MSKTTCIFQRVRYKGVVCDFITSRTYSPCFIRMCIVLFCLSINEHSVCVFYSLTL